jgi:hypothetical protein
VTKLGGNANNGTNAGAAYWNLNNSSANTNQNIRSHSSWFKILDYDNFGSCQNINYIS